MNSVSSKINAYGQEDYRLPPGEYYKNGELSREIYTCASENYAGYIREHLEKNIECAFHPVSFYGMLCALTEIFSHQFCNMPDKAEKPYTLVLGNTETGKSLLIGNLSGHPLADKEYFLSSGRVKKVLDYQSESKDRRPFISHCSSETHGAPVYGSFIDTMGLDRDILDEKICSAAAVNLSVRYYRPKKVIVCFNSSLPSSHWGGGFIELIKALGSMLHFSSEKNLWPHVLFAVKIGSDGNSDKDLLESYIEDALFRIKNKDRARFHKKAIEILDLREKWKNLVVADFASDRTKEEILQWLKSESEPEDPSEEFGNPSENFNALNLIYEGEARFKTALNAATTYFKWLEDKEVLYGRCLSLEIGGCNSEARQAELSTQKELLVKTLENIEIKDDPDVVDAVERKRNEIRLIDEEAEFLSKISAGHREGLANELGTKLAELRQKLDYYAYHNRLFKKINSVRDKIL